MPNAPHLVALRLAHGLGSDTLIISNSTLIQELGFQQKTLLEALNQALPGQEIKRLRFRLGSIG